MYDLDYNNSIIAAGGISGFVYLFDFFGNLLTKYPAHINHIRLNKL